MVKQYGFAIIVLIGLVLIHICLLNIYSRNNKADNGIVHLQTLNSTLHNLMAEIDMLSSTKLSIT